MIKGDFGIPVDDLQKIKQFGINYANGIGLSLEQITIFYLWSEYQKTTIDIGRILNQNPSTVRRKLVKVLREFIKCMNNWDTENL